MAVIKPIQNNSPLEMDIVNPINLQVEDLQKINTRGGLKKLLKQKNIDYSKVLEDLSYEKQQRHCK